MHLPLNRNYFPLQPKMVHLYVVLSDMRILFSGRHGKYLLSVIPGLWENISSKLRKRGKAIIIKDELTPPTSTNTGIMKSSNWIIPRLYQR